MLLIFIFIMYLPVILQVIVPVKYLMEKPQIYQHAFQMLPTPSVVVFPNFPEFTVIEANEAFSNFAQTPKSALLGTGLLKALEQKTDSAFIDWLDIFRRVSETQAPCGTTLGRDVPEEQPNPGHYHVECVPVFDGQHTIQCIIAYITTCLEPAALSETRKSTVPSLNPSRSTEQGQEPINFGTWRWDISNDSLQWSDSLYAIYGLDKTSFKATFEAYLEMVHSDDRETVKRKINQALKNSGSYELEETIVRPDGKSKSLQSVGTVRVDEKGNPVEVVGVTLDISESKNTRSRLIKSQKLLRNLVRELKTSNKRFSMANKATNDAIYDMDLLENRLYWGEGFYRLFGYKKPPHPLNPKNLFAFVHPADIEAVRERFHRLLNDPTTTKWSNQFRFLKADQTYAFVEENGFAVRNKEGKIIRIIGAIRDISARKLDELKMSTLHQELERNLRILAISNAELEQFAYTVSHDLQEPLRMITGFLTQLEKKYRDRLDDKGKQYIFYAVDGAKRMRRIILDLLSFSRAGRMDGEKEEVDLNAVLDEIKKLFKRKINEKKAIFEIERLPVIHTLKSSVRLIFQNLISNSLTYQQEGVPPIIRIYCEEMEDFWQFTVADNGIGIDQAFLDNVFIIFRRLDGNENLPGTGMGLAVSKKIIEHLGGEIWIESKKGKGSQFHFTLAKSGGV